MKLIGHPTLPCHKQGIRAPSDDDTTSAIRKCRLCRKSYLVEFVRDEYVRLKTGLERFRAVIEEVAK